MQSCTLLLFVAGCLEPMTAGSPPTAGSATTTTGAPTATPSDYDLEILDVAAHYKSAAFTKINSTAYASSLTGVGQINLYAYGDAITYKSIHPETATTARVGVGTVIVREVLDTTGAVTDLTMIAKAPSGFDGSLGDWWFGETDPTGAPKLAGGVAQVGKLAACHSCHVPREAEDYLFGVPAANQKTGH